MKKILKKLISVPNRFEAFLQRRKLPTLILILAFCLFTLFNLWWYGAYEDLFKSPQSLSFYDLREEAIEETFKLFPEYEHYTERIKGEEWDPEYEKYLKKRLSRLTTDALIDTLLDGFLTGIYTSDDPTYAYQDMTTVTAGHYHVFFEELASRKNAGSKLVKRYRQTPLFVTLNGEVQDNLGDLIEIEILLAESKYQTHLLPWVSLEKIREEQQEKRFSFVGKEEARKSRYGMEEYYVRWMRHNYLYTDAYDENGWNEEKLNEYASKYIDPEEWGFTE